MYKFKRGDNVHVSSLHHYRNGHEGVIVNIWRYDQNDLMPYQVRFDDGSVDWFQENELGEEVQNVNV